MLGFIPLPFDIPNWLGIPLLVIFIPLALYNGEILWALVSLLLLVYCIWESFSDEEKVSNSPPSDDWEGIPEPVSNWQPDEDSRIQDAVVEGGMPYQEAVQREYGTWDGRSRYE